MKNACATIAACLLLAGCSSEPSDSDMLAALNANPKFIMTLALASGMGGGNDAQAAKLRDSGVVEKSGCADAKGAPGYVCDFRWGMKQPRGTSWGGPMKARFFKSGASWAVEL